MKEFLLSDESVNSHGFVVKTSGISLDRFRNNPVMFYNHAIELGTAGRWDNLRLENDALYGAPVFDEENEPGRTVKNKVDNGFLKGVSVGLRNCQFDDINGIKTVVKCELFEVSICDIPANKNALQLYYEDKPVDYSTYLKLSLNYKTMEKQDLKLIRMALELPENTTVDIILSAINGLKQMSAPFSMEETLALAQKDGIITLSEKNDLSGLFADKPQSVYEFLNNRRKEHHVKLESGYDVLVKDNFRKFGVYPHNFIYGDLKKLALNDMAAFKQLIDRMPERKPVTEMIREASGSHSKSDWTLSDYRKKAPQELQRNPQLYQELLAKEQSK